MLCLLLFAAGVVSTAHAVVYNTRKAATLSPFQQNLEEQQLYQLQSTVDWSNNGNAMSVSGYEPAITEPFSESAGPGEVNRPRPYYAPPPDVDDDDTGIGVRPTPLGDSPWLMMALLALAYAAFRYVRSSRTRNARS